MKKIIYLKILKNNNFIFLSIQILIFWLIYFQKDIYFNTMSRDNRSIFIGKLSRRTREEDIEEEFNKFGRIRDVDLHQDRGFAFI